MLKKTAAVFFTVAVVAVLASPASLSNDGVFSSGPGWNELLYGKGIFTTGKLNVIQSRSNEDAVKIEELNNLLSDYENLKTVYFNYRTLFEKTNDLYQGRLDHFKYQLLQIASHNLEADVGKHAWWMGVNYFTDLTQSELQGMGSSYEPLTNTSNVEIGYEPEFSGVAAPDYLNYTEQGVVGSVKNQTPCGACAMFAAASLVESTIARTYGVPPPALSTQELADCSDLEWCCESKGTNCKTWSSALAHYKYMIEHGISAWDDYPYIKANGVCQRGSKARVAKVTHFDQILDKSEAELKQILADKGPLQAQIHQEGRYEKGVMTRDACKANGLDLNHSVLLVGYGTDSATGLDYWLIKNSYGPEWGEFGYMRIERNNGNTCKITQTLYSITVKTV